MCVRKGGKRRQGEERGSACVCVREEKGGGFREKVWVGVRDQGKKRWLA